MTSNKKLCLWSIFIISISIFLQLFAFVLSKNQWLLLIDNNISQFFYQNRNKFFDYLFVVFSYLGETKAILLYCAILLALPSRKKIGIPATALVATSGILNFLIKIIVMRTRPEGLFLTQEILGYTFPAGYSFPSGHSQTANIFFLSTSLLYANYTKNEKLKNLLILSAIVFCFLMWIARIYLCVHYFSDVFAGLLLMISLITLFLLVMQNKKFYKLNIYK